MSPQITNKPLDFAKDVIWMGLSQILISLLGIITLPALTKSFSAETYGIWVQVSTTVGVISPLLTLQFGSAVVRYLSGEPDNVKRRRAIGTMLTAILITILAVICVISLFPHQTSEFLFASRTYLTFVEITFVWSFLDALFTFFIAYLRSLRKIKWISIIQAALAISKVSLVIVFVKAGFSLQWIGVGIVTIEAVFIVAICYLIFHREGFPVFGFYRIREYLAFCLPQTPGLFLLWIIGASDRYFITHIINLAQTGIYFSSNALGSMVALFYSPIGFVLLPAVSAAWNQKHELEVKKYFEYSTRVFLTLAIPAALGLAILSQPLLKLLATSEYMAGWPIVLMISIGTIFLGIYQINVYIIYLVNQTKWLPMLIVVASASTIGLCIVLLPKIGILGAAVANMTSYFILAAIVTIWTRKTVTYDFNFRYLGKIILASLVMAACLYFLKLNSAAGIILSIVLGVVIFGITLWIIKAFDEQDKQMIKQLCMGITPAFIKKHF